MFFFSPVAFFAVVFIDLFKHTVVKASSLSFLSPPSPDCTCLNWNQTYSSHRAICGEGHELFLATKLGISTIRAKLLMNSEFCLNFYKRIDDNVCINVNMGNEPGKWYSGQWCYVSASCDSASPVQSAPDVRVKMCTDGHDKMLRNMSPEDLHAYARAVDFDVGLLVKMAYPVDQDVKWHLAKGFFGQSPNLQMSSDQVEKLQGIITSGQPVVLDSHDGHPPFAVVQGRKAYLVELDEAHFIRGHMNTLTTWKCVHGCNAGSAAQS